MFVFELYQVHEALNYDTISVHRLGDHSCKIMRLIVVGNFQEWAVRSPSKIDWTSLVNIYRGMVWKSGHAHYHPQQVSYQ